MRLVLSGLIVLGLAGAQCAPRPPAVEEEAPAPTATTPPASPTPQPTSTPQPTPTPEPAPAPEGPRAGGVLVVAVTSDPGHFNPGISTGFDVHAVADSMFNGLVALDRNFDPVPDLAQSWEISEDSTTYTFHLHEGVTWHDGQPFTSADVKFTFDEVLLKFHARTKGGLEGVLEAIETPDERTVVFRFREPYAILLQRLDVTEAPILPKHLYEGTDPQTAEANLQPVGTGPFVLARYRPGEEIRVTRNESYFKEGLPHLDEVVFRVIPEASTQLAALEAGEVDYVWRIPGPDAGRLEALGTITLDQVPTGPGGGNCIMTLAFNLERPRLQDERVRRAFARAIDRTALLEQVQFGLGRVAEAPISSAIPWAHHGGLEPYPHDPQSAAALFEEAGGAGQSLNLLHFPQFSKWGEAMRADLAEAGFDLWLEPLERAAMVERVFTHRDFDTTLISYCNNADPEIGVTRMYVSSNIKPIPFSNAAAYANPEVDTLFEAAASTADREVRAEAYRQVQEILWRELPYWWLVETDFLVGYSAEFDGFQAWSGHFAEAVRLK